MLPELVVVTLILILGNIFLRHFEPFMPLWRRVVKIVLILCITAAISYFFGRAGVVVVYGLASLAVVYIHAIWLPRHGINGWTAEPRDKYYALRGWPLPKK